MYNDIFSILISVLIIFFFCNSADSVYCGKYVHTYKKTSTSCAYNHIIKTNNIFLNINICRFYLTHPLIKCIIYPLFGTGSIQVRLRHTRGAHCVRQNMVLRLWVVGAPKGEGSQGPCHQDEPLPARIRTDMQTDTKVCALSKTINLCSFFLNLSNNK